MFTRLECALMVAVAVLLFAGTMNWLNLIACTMR
jgi:hypothetical protein